MTWQQDTAAVIPCLNEESTIRWLVPLVQRHVNAVCVIDDGSQDGTAQAAENAGAQVIRHTSSRGKGAALRAGWRWARTQGYVWALALDGDGQHAPADIPSFFRRAESSNATLTVGNRMGDAGKMPFPRRLVNRWMSRRLSGLVGRELPDSQCGYRLMHLASFAALPITTTHFEIESEVLAAFVRAGHRVEFVPISVIYKSERSKIQPLRDSWRWFRWWRLMKSPASASQPKLEIGAQPSVADA